MALQTCKECGGQVSDTAAACPQCGAKPRRKIGVAVKLLMGMTGVGLVLAMMAPRAPGSFEKPRAAGIPEASSVASPAARQPDQYAQQTTTAINVTMALKQSMRDPDSLILESIRVDESARIACVEYRARNGFNGMSREFAIYRDGKGSNSASVWNANCKKPMTDMMDSVARLMKYAG